MSVPGLKAWWRRFEIKDFIHLVIAVDCNNRHFAVAYAKLTVFCLVGVTQGGVITGG